MKTVKTEASRTVLLWIFDHSGKLAAVISSVIGVHAFVLTKLRRRRELEVDPLVMRSLRDPAVKRGMHGFIGGAGDPLTSAKETAEAYKLDREAVIDSLTGFVSWNSTDNTNGLSR